MHEHSYVAGASIALLSRNRQRGGFDLLAMQRDDIDGLPYQNMWEFPGGTIEPGETPVQCALRELHEETGLTLSPDTVVWEAYYPRQLKHEDGRPLYSGFFVALTDKEALGPLQKGAEGKDCRWLWSMTFMGLVTESDLSRVKAIPDHIDRYMDFISKAHGRTVRHIGSFCLAPAPLEATGYTTDHQREYGVWEAAPQIRAA